VLLSGVVSGGDVTAGEVSVGEVMLALLLALSFTLSMSRVLRRSLERVRLAFGVGVVGMDSSGVSARLSWISTLRGVCEDLGCRGVRLPSGPVSRKKVVSAAVSGFNAGF